uniref:Putative D14a protein n=1 Tax=Chlorokybus atmophyticus TaxID=3144 RepID=I6PHZ9_CHLAT|nr:putative D14a protein [Chlorokybus atmophyticus]
MQVNTSGPLARKHNVQVYGSGDKVMVFGHGFGTDHTVWQRIIPGLVREFTCVAFDHACASSLTGENFDFERYSTIHGYADDLLNLLAELGMQSCIYVGASLGANVGMLASIEAPHLFERLIAICGAPGYIYKPEEGFEGPFRLEDLDVVFSAMQDNYLSWVAGFAPRAIVEDNSEAIDEFARGLVQLRPDVAISTARTSFLTDFRDALPLVQVPCVLLQGREDHAVPEHITVYMASRLKECTYEILPTKGHLPHISGAPYVLAAVRKHLGLSTSHVAMNDMMC